MSKYFAESELIINEDGSCFHLHLRPEQVADKVILVGDPGRVALVAPISMRRNAKSQVGNSTPSPAHIKVSESPCRAPE